MKLSTDRILTTHVGSLPRPPKLLALMSARETGAAVDRHAYDAAAAQAVAAIVAEQVAHGIDVVNDGEMSKLSYSFYIDGRVNGIGRSAAALAKSHDVMTGFDMIEHPDFAALMPHPYDAVDYPACIGPVSYGDRGALERDLANLKAAAATSQPRDVFMTCASPGVLTKFVVDLHYNNEDAYVAALAEAMRVEYQAVVAAGFVLQIDCPDLGSARSNQYRRLSDAEFLKIAARNVEALNHATAGLPPDRMRMHICWGNYEGPHTHDIPFAKIAPIVFGARPQGVSVEGANPRHAHEWEDLAALAIPDDKVLIPGMLDTTTMFVEHPRLIAQRLGRYAAIVGRERVLAGVDCGFATFALSKPMVPPSVIWAKFDALAAGARLASEKLWP